MKNKEFYKNLLLGKRGLIIGIANERSLAWGITEACYDAGANLALTYQNESLKKRIEPLAAKVKSNLIAPCDVQDDSSLDKLFQLIKKEFNSLDFLVHSIAYSEKEELKGRYIDTSRQNFLNTMEISCYSLTKIARKTLPLLHSNSSILTMSYMGAERVIPHYNVMGVAKAALEASVKYLAADLGNEGIRVNGISAGPIKTLAASGIGDFRYILKWNQYNSPLQRNTTLDDVGKAALYLLSDLSSGTTGEIIHVDSGYNIIGMKNVNAPDISKV